MKKIPVLLGSSLIGAVLAAVPSVTGQEMAHMAEHLLAALDSDQRAKGSFDLHDEERENWHFIPRPRQGISLGEMTPAQRKLTHAMLSTLLSNSGLQQAEQIMFLEQILYELENRSPRRNPDGYFFSVFGTPGRSQTWAWRFEGHHLSLNVSLFRGEVASVTPAFFGANPAEVRAGSHAGLRVLAPAEDLARRLVESFPAEKRRRVILTDTAPADIITSASRKAHLGEFEGVSVAEMTPDQGKQLLELLKHYAERFRPELAAALLGRAQSGSMNQIYFAWAGSTKIGAPHYYRIHGPEFVVEYDNTQNEANHIHSVWRDFRGDFGRDLLKEHYQESH